MSFGNFARLTRDTSRPLAERAGALRSCVQLYRPIGFRATLSFLRPDERDEAALLRALSLLEASRNLRKTHVLRYAASRTRSKLSGHRVPAGSEPNPLDHFGYWYGAPREAARHAIDFWCRKRIPDLVAAGHPPLLGLLAAVGAGTPPPPGLVAELCAPTRTVSLLPLLRFADVATGGQFSYPAWLAGLNELPKARDGR